MIIAMWIGLMWYPGEVPIVIPAAAQTEAECLAAAKALNDVYKAKRQISCQEMRVKLNLGSVAK